LFLHLTAGSMNIVVSSWEC